MAKKQLLLSFHVHEGSHRQQNQYLPGKQSFMTSGRNCIFLTILQTGSTGSVCDWRQKQGPEESKLQFLETELICCWFLSALLLDHYCLEQGLLFALFLSLLHLFPNTWTKFGQGTEESLLSVQLAQQQETYYSKWWVGSNFWAHFKIPWS